MTSTETDDDAPTATEPNTSVAGQTNDSALRTVKLDAAVLRKLVVATVLDLGDDSGSHPAARAAGRLPEDGSL